MSDKQTETPAYVSTAQAAHLTSLSRAWFERSRWSGGGPPFVKLGAAVRYPLDELHAWMRARLRTSSTDDPVSIERPTTEKFSPNSALHGDLAKNGSRCRPQSNGGGRHNPPNPRRRKREGSDMLRNDAPGGSRGQGTVVWANDRDPITTSQGDCQRDRARNLLTALRAEYPVFREYLPLTLRIREALHAAFPDATRTAVIHALARHCRSDRYIRVLASGGSRYNLAGVPSGEVSEGHRAAAVLVLARRAEKSVKPRNPPRAPVASAAPKPPRLAKPGRPA